VYTVWNGISVAYYKLVIWRSVAVQFSADPHPTISLNADPDPALHFNVDPDPASHFNADLYPALHFNADPEPDPAHQKW
jgi:hypothetical protein